RDAALAKRIAKSEYLEGAAEQCLGLEAQQQVERLFRRANGRADAARDDGDPGIGQRHLEANAGRVHLEGKRDDGAADAVLAQVHPAVEEFAEALRLLGREIGKPRQECSARTGRLVIGGSRWAAVADRAERRHFEELAARRERQRGDILEATDALYLEPLKLAAVEGRSGADMPQCLDEIGGALPRQIL